MQVQSLTKKSKNCKNKSRRVDHINNIILFNCNIIYQLKTKKSATMHTHMTLKTIKTANK